MRSPITNQEKKRYYTKKRPEDRKIPGRKVSIFEPRDTFYKEIGAILREKGKSLGFLASILGLTRQAVAYKMKESREPSLKELRRILAEIEDIIGHEEMRRLTSKYLGF